ncbi:MAG: Vi polysaccharide biosynthesis protein VipA/TviB [Proteobacteria bacterium]|nr:Vi polysaccharide biosynthesis protein VipA/TviB [Pseudomonadota bacterium]
MNNQRKIAVVGLGYVGLPLAVEFAKYHKVTGYDVDVGRVDGLRNFSDKTGEVENSELEYVSKNLELVSELNDIADCDFYIITVPTPIDDAKEPDLTAISAASKSIGEILTVGNIVVYESTVYPGVTEDHCVPILESVSGLKYNEDFFCGYSPERINPGDKDHRLPDIVKVVSGSNGHVLDIIEEVYCQIIKAGVHRVSKIKVAEAAKVIENTQRDLNIALVNELSKIFSLLDIDTEETLIAAGTKWNFIPFRPGLVGGHCIGVDPYYLTHRAQKAGYDPQVILSGRRINDEMAQFIADKISQLVEKNRGEQKKRRLLILGATFKEDCPDIRNSKVFDMLVALESNGFLVDIHDPYANSSEVEKEFGIDLLDDPVKNLYDVIVLAVKHKEYVRKGHEWIRALGKKDVFICDLKYVLPKNQSDMRL